MLIPSRVQSWGGILAIEYALKHQHEGHLKAMIVSNMVASIESFLVCSMKWKKTLPPDLFEQVEKIEREKDWSNPAYEKIMMVCKPFQTIILTLWQYVWNHVLHRQGGICSMTTNLWKELLTSSTSTGSIVPQDVLSHTTLARTLHKVPSTCQ